MKLLSIVTIFFIFPSLLMGQKNSPTKLAMEWSETLDGSFSFKNEWSYPEGIFRNKYGQLSCDALCPEKAIKLKDPYGKIYEDSLSIFYSLVDTSHIPYSIKSEAECYECAGTNHVTTTLNEDGLLQCKTWENASTHSSLTFVFEGDSCFVYMDYNSIRPIPAQRFYYKSGTVRIEKEAFDQGILKMSFDLYFRNTMHKKRPLHWKGNIYSKIEVSK